MNSLGIRHEDKYAPERRTPLVPSDVRKLVNEHGIPVYVERSQKRIFTHAEFEDAGAGIVDDVSFCDIVLGVKEMPVGSFRPGMVCVYFSHVIKGQRQNMAMLRDIMESGATLIDYERILDQNGNRLIFFGRYAGIAGMINTLWSTGQRYEKLGKATPFSTIKQASRYDSLEAAKEDIRRSGEAIASSGPGEGAGPLIFAVTGDGNVAQGALEILDLLPVTELAPGELRDLDRSRLDPGAIYKVNLIPADYMVHKKGKKFSLQDYIAFPDHYESRFEEFLPNINVLVNGIYWDERYPRLVTKKWLREKNQHLNVIGDITCDPDGSVECTVKATEIEDPVFVYDPETDSHNMGFDGPGVTVMAVDILPSELPREASEQFSSLLSPWIPHLAAADYDDSFADLNLPPELKGAVIVHKKKLTPDYGYLKAYLNQVSG